MVFARLTPLAALLLTAACAAHPGGTMSIAGRDAELLKRFPTPTAGEVEQPASPAGEPGQATPTPGDSGQPTTAAQEPSQPAGSAMRAQPTPVVVELDPFLTMDAPPRCPQEMALILGQVCIDRWEASLVQMMAGGVDKPWSPFNSLNGNKAVLRAVSQPGVKPQGYISGVDAGKACRASGKRLCTEREWVVACRGPKRTTYPYGRLRKKRACNDDGRTLHPVADVTQRLSLPGDRMWYEGMDHPLINQLDDTLTNTGEHPDCTNDYGVYDMVGNLHEWIDDPSGTFRGGFYMDTRMNGEGCDYATTAHSKKYHDYSTGFRCCMDADPVE